MAQNNVIFSLIRSFAGVPYAIASPNTMDSSAAPISAADGPNPRQYAVGPAPAVKERLTASGNAVSSSDDDNPVLMEARLSEMVASVRQLIRSNEQIEEALLEDVGEGSGGEGGGEGGEGKYDEELLSALRENDDLISRRRREAEALASRLKGRRGGVEFSIGDKIPPYDGSALLRRLEGKKDGGGGGLYL